MEQRPVVGRLRTTDVIVEPETICSVKPIELIKGFSYPHWVFEHQLPFLSPFALAVSHTASAADPAG